MHSGLSIHGYSRLWKKNCGRLCGESAKIMDIFELSYKATVRYIFSSECVSPDKRANT